MGAVLTIIAAAAWEFSVLVDCSTLPHQAGSNDQVRSTFITGAKSAVDLVLAFLLFLEGDLFAFLLDCLE